MRVFITGASGWIGTALTHELIMAGHDVTGLARSETSAEMIRAAGATPVLGDMQDHDILVAEARRADATAHLAFTPDFSNFDAAVAQELVSIHAIAAAIEGTGKAFFAASGTPTNLGELATEQSEPDPEGPAGVRARTARAVLALSDRGIRSGLVRMPRSVHGEMDHSGLITMLVSLDRQLRTAAYIGDGRNRWPAVHISDAGRLFRLALEHAPAGSVLHAVGEEGIPMLEVAVAIGEKTGLPVSAVDPEDLGMFGALLGGDQPASSAATRELLDWEPTGPTLLEDIRAGYYTA